MLQTVTKHTPGPWFKGRAGEIYARSQGMLGQVVLGYAHCHQRVEEYEANHALMAAAPEMLASLKELTLYCDIDCEDDGYRLRAQAAIDKAEGRV